VTVYLVGAGPGDGDLLTVRAARLLGEAEVVVRDRLVDESVMEYVNPHAQVIDVGKGPGESFRQASINQLLVDLSDRYDTVVRLKGGDPFVFGRGGEEVITLREAGVACVVVPGLSSALAGPLAAGIPVTHRGVSRGVTIVSARGADGEVTNFYDLAHPDLSLVILMGVEHRGVIAQQLLDGGLADDTPVAVIERAWSEQQRTTRGTLRTLAHFDVLPPAIIVVGGVAAMDLRSLTLADVALL
jgi:uroporphyrin-III C-methyltransferase